MYYYFWQGPLSQWYPSEFELDDVKYNCAEQYMMAQKAYLFQDKETLSKIMDSKSPREQKALGRLVKNFNSTAWMLAAEDIVIAGNFAKFTQNEWLKQTLLETKGSILVEASPFDTIWGIGINETDAMNGKQWRGQNLLGKCLIKVRTLIENHPNFIFSKWEPTNA